MKIKKQTYQNRIDTLRKAFGSDFQALMVTDLSNVRYLCGFSGSSGILIIGKKYVQFFTDFRYEEQSAKEIGTVAEIEVYKKSLMESMMKFLKSKRVKKLGIEKSMSIGQYLNYKEKFSGELIPVGGLVEKVRQIKDKEEASLLKKVFSIADEALEKLQKDIKPGKTEIEIAARLEYLMREGGASGCSFDTIVASGVNASCPHAQPTDKKLKKGEMVKIDFGAVYQGYCSDMTRTFFLGKATKKFKEVYNTVLEAQTAAVKGLKAGKKCNEIDALARDHISSKGYGEYFGHNLGHSFGLNVHEMPSLGTKCFDEIEPGMTFTVEPGIYLPGWGGVRIEDSYLVREKSLLRLTKFPNNLTEL